MKSKKKEQIKIDEIKYYPNANVKCSCGASFQIGSTDENISVEVCSACHPYYTGTQRLVDTSGRVDKFKERLAKKEKMLNEKKVVKKNNVEEKKNTEKKLKRVDIKDLKRKDIK